MPPLPTPVLPFPGFKWKWASVAPTESLNKAPVFLGVLRALGESEGQSLNSVDFRNRLLVIEDEIRVPELSLIRTDNRNIIRNSGQYWKGKGLLENRRGAIRLTDYGRGLASGVISRDEFVTHTINSFVLPSAIIMKPNECAQWRQHGIVVKPLRLIVDILAEMALRDESQSYITTTELARIVVPLSSLNSDVDTYVEAILGFRANPGQYRDWPNVTRKANDLRILREYLLFLSNFGVLEQVNQSAANQVTRFDEKYCIASDYIEQNDLPRVVENVLPFVPGFQRQRRLTNNWVRDPRFSRDVIGQNGRCVVTGESIRGVLEAAHIVPVKENGSDEVSNGLCMRCDIHKLFDAGDIRINPTGDVRLSARTRRSTSYGGLPTRIVFPDAVRIEHVKWRWDFL